MQRQFIIIVGNQGFGKSVWMRQFCSSEKRLLAFDPIGTFPQADFATDPDNWIDRVVNDSHQREEFRYATIHSDEVPMFGNAAFAAGKCTFVIDECALVFRRGEECPAWAKPLIFMGRHREVNLILVAQRMTLIPLDIRSQAGRIITFRQTDTDDVTAICKRVGKQYADILPTLPRLTCMDWDGERDHDPVKIYPVSIPKS